MFIKSGLTDDQINHIYGFVYDSEAEGPGAALDPRKIQEAVLRFYDKPWDVPSIHGPVLKTSDGACGNDAPSSDVVSSPVQGWQQGQLHARALKEETFPTEDGYEYNDWDESWQQYPAEEYDDWEEEADLETFLAGESDWIHRDVLDSDVLD